MYKGMLSVVVFILGFLTCFYNLSPSYAQNESSQAPTAIANSAGASQVQQPVHEGESLHLESYPHYAGQEASITMNKTMVLKSEEEWQSAWSQTGIKAPIPLPARSMAVAVFLGKRPTHNYSVRISEAIMNGNDMVVKFFENKPSIHQPATGKPSYPWVIQVLPGVEGRVRFVTANGVR